MNSKYILIFISLCCLGLEALRFMQEQKPLLNQQAPTSFSYTLINENNEYFCEIQVGNPPQKFRVILDTGSEYLLLPSQDCKSDACKRHNRFKYKESTTFKKSNKSQVKINFGTGEIKGSVITDRVCIQKVCAESLPLILMKDASDMPFLTARFDGVLGLGRRKIGNNSQITNIVQMLYKQRKIIDNSFSLYFSRGPDDEFASQLLLGGQSHKLYEQKMDYIEVIDQMNGKKTASAGLWRVAIDSITIGTEALDLCMEQKCFGYFDSGSEYMGGDEALTNMIIDTLDLSHDCKNLESMKFIKINIQGHEYSLEPQDYILQREIKQDVVDKNGNENIESQYKCAVEMTKIAFDPQNKSHNLVLGLPFLKKYYTTYIFSTRRNTGISTALVGIAQALHQEVVQLKYSS